MFIATSSSRSWAHSLVILVLLSGLLVGCSTGSRPSVSSVIEESTVATSSLNPVTIALFGDSTFETYYLSAERNPALVQYHGTSSEYDARLHVQVVDELKHHGIEATVVNFGVSGMDSSEAISDENAQPSIWMECLSTDPDIVIIRFGPNDMTAGVSDDDFRANLVRMVEEARDTGVVPVFVTNNLLDYPEHSEIDWAAPENLGRYTDAIISVAQEYDLTLADARGRFATEIAAGNWDLYGHNDKSYLKSWDDGSAIDTPAYFTNIHQWSEGTKLIAEEITRALITYEPLTGGDVSAPGRANAWMPETEGD